MGKERLDFQRHGDGCLTKCLKCFLAAYFHSCFKKNGIKLKYKVYEFFFIVHHVMMLVPRVVAKIGQETLHGILAPPTSFITR